MKLFLPIFLLLFASSAQGQMLQAITNGGGKPLTLNPGWAFGQKGHLSACAGGASTCNLSFQPTIANSIWIAAIVSDTNITITSVTGTLDGATFTHCSNCHNFQTGHGGIDVVYGVGGTAGSTGGPTLNFSGACGNTICQASFTEIVLPAGYSFLSLDASGNTGSASCSTTCPTVALTLTGTDAVIQITSGFAVVSYAGFNSYAATYLTDYNEDGLALNVNSAPATTFSIQSSVAPSWVAVAGLAFKSTAGTFAVPAPQFSLANYLSTYQGNSGGSLTNCAPTCTLSSTNVPGFTTVGGAGHLVFIHQADSGGRVLNSLVDGSNTWVVPAGCSLSSGGNGISCAYSFTTAAVSSINVTNSGNDGSNGFAIYDITHTGSCTWSADASGATANPAETTSPGQALTLTGSNDVLFQEMAENGGSSDPTLYPQPFNNKGSNSFAGGTEFIINYANTAVLLNSTNGSAPNYHGQNVVSAVSGIAFKCN